MTKDDKQGRDEPGDPQLASRNGGNGGTVLSGYLNAELNAEQARPESLERHGLVLITVGRLRLVASVCLAVAIGSLAALAAFLIVK